MTVYVSENFEGAGLPAGWSASGVFDADYDSDPIDNTKSLWLNNTSSVGPPAITPIPSAYLYFTMRFDGSLPASSNTYIASLYDDQGSYVGNLQISNSVPRFKIYHGSKTLSGPTNLVAGTEYHIWIEYVASDSGASNGILGLSYSETITKPEAPAVRIVNGDCEEDFAELAYRTTTARGFTPVVFDRLIIADAEISVPAMATPSTAPTLFSATLNSAGTEIALAFSKSVVFGSGGNGGFALSLSGGAAAATYSSGSGTAILTYSIDRAIQSAETGTIAYTQPGDGVEDALGEDMLTLASLALVNNSTQGAGAPSISNSAINSAGTTITLSFSEVVNFGAGGNAGVTLTMTDGAVTATYSSGSGSSSLVYSLSRAIQYDESGTLSYSQPGDGIENATNTDLASIASVAVTNSSSVGAPAGSISATIHTGDPASPSVYNGTFNYRFLNSDLTNTGVESAAGQKTSNGVNAVSFTDAQLVSGSDYYLIVDQPANSVRGKRFTAA